MRRSLAALVLAGLAGCTHHAPAEPAHYYAATDPANPRVARLPDSWPCGAGTCLDRATWHPIGAELADALAEGDYSAVDWRRCWEAIGDTSYYVCPDGLIESS